MAERLTIGTTPPVLPKPQVGVVSTAVAVPASQRTRGDFRRVEFDRLLAQLAYRVSWQKALYCPCRNNEDTEQPDVTCTLCKGRGFIYDDPLEIRASITRFAKNISIFERFGEFAYGTVYMTVMPEHRLAYRDRIAMLDAEMVFQQVVPAPGTQLMGARYPIVGVEVVRTLARVFVYGTDFKLTDDGRISWIIDPPAASTLVSLRYRIRPPFLVLDHLNTFRDTRVKSKSVEEKNQPLPIQVLAKLEFLDKTA